VDQTNLISTLTAATTGLVGLIVGAFFTHMLASRRERAQKKREFILNYLIEAWRNIYIGSQDHVDIERKAPALERGITDVALFGTPKQIEMARTIAQEIVAKGSSNTTEILNGLRDDIRSELGLEKASNQPFFFSLVPKKKSPTQHNWMPNS
jgi:hypothetical protein